MRLSWNAPLQAILFTALLMCNPASCGKVHRLPMKEQLAIWWTLVSCQGCLRCITQQTVDTENYTWHGMQAAGGER